MEENKKYNIPNPVVDRKEAHSLDVLTNRYNKLITPSKAVKLGKKTSELIPEKVKLLGNEITQTISSQELYKQSMELVVSGFKIVEEQAANFTISEKR